MSTTLESTPRTSSSLINGIDVEALQGAIEACSANPAAAQTRWSVTTNWVGGTRTDTRVTEYSIGGQRVEKDWTI